MRPRNRRDGEVHPRTQTLASRELPKTGGTACRGGHRERIRCRRERLDAEAVPRRIDDQRGGRRIEVEVWELSTEAFGSFVDGIPAPLGIGTVELEDGEQVKGFVCEPYATRGAQDVSDLGGWRAYLQKGRGP